MVVVGRRCSTVGPSFEVWRFAETPDLRPWHGPNPKPQALARAKPQTPGLGMWHGPNPDRHTRPCVVKSPTHSPSTTRRRTSNRTPSTSEQRQGHIPGLTTFQCVRSLSTGSTTTHPCASVGVGRGGSEREPGGSSRPRLGFLATHSTTQRKGRGRATALQAHLIRAKGTSEGSPLSNAREVLPLAAPPPARLRRSVLVVVAARAGGNKLRLGLGFLAQDDTS